MVLVTPTEEPMAVTESIEKAESEATATGVAPIAAKPALTPAPCSGNLTSVNMEGPYYSPGSPLRSSLLEPGLPGTPILIFGGVFDQGCQPIAGAKVDFWQADSDGQYDNSGYRLRGYVLTEENGFYAIESIAPGLYPGRPVHIHVKVFSPEGKELLTTQLYFPGSEDSADVAGAPDLLVSYQGPDEQGRQMVPFNFIVALP